MAGIRYLTDAEPRTPPPYSPPVVVPTVGKVLDAQRGSHTSASSTRTVVFPRAFSVVPHISLMARTGGSRAFVVTSKSTTGFSYQDINSDNITVEWQAFVIAEE